MSVSISENRQADFVSSAHFCNTLTLVRLYLSLLDPSNPHWFLLGFARNFPAMLYLLYNNLVSYRILSCRCRWHLECVMYKQLALMSVSSLASDPGSHHHVLIDRSGYRPPRPAWGSAEIHRTPDHHTHGGPHWPLWFPGGRRESREALGHRHAVSVPRPLKSEQ